MQDVKSIPNRGCSFGLISPREVHVHPPGVCLSPDNNMLSIQEAKEVATFYSVARIAHRAVVCYHMVLHWKSPQLTAMRASFAELGTVEAVGEALSKHKAFAEAAVVWRRWQPD